MRLTSKLCSEMSPDAAYGLFGRRTALPPRLSLLLPIVLRPAAALGCSGLCDRGALQHASTAAVLVCAAIVHGRLARLGRLGGCTDSTDDQELRLTSQSADARPRIALSSESSKATQRSYEQAQSGCVGVIHTSSYVPPAYSSALICDGYHEGGHDF